jgi:serine/threonine-protein kinase HipA
LRQFGDEPAIVVERYDRVRTRGVLSRVHQEDMCQALAVLPTRKYESEGGPGMTAITALLARHSSDEDVDVARFIDANIFNWLIAGTDAHAKNYSVLHAAGPDLRLAPLYDVITALPYPQFEREKVCLAMAVNGERVVDRITGAHWRALARAVGFLPDLVINRIVDLGERIPTAIDRVIRQAGGNRAIMERLAEPVARHVRACLKRLG